MKTVHFKLALCSAERGHLLRHKQVIDSSRNRWAIVALVDELFAYS